ncbi:unnamed protein product [Spodoptera littoralis]|uniref:Beta-glucosidase n=1 Tax=Spodoptera littoralis TaxID=7109 RepID=A0A9P0N420_SPOLI|nr:unnamed protein product [Spodoptera littoralis]CAH1640813.1 unnamed protein product [Spodoptera littoralis]
MLWVTTVVLWASVSHVYGYSKQFPPGFKFGAATAAYQVEGAYNVSGKFSISWPRLLPTGLPNEISDDGKNYYNNLIDGLLEKGIEPIVSIYHWEMPQLLQDLGGWANPKISDWFADYARVVFTLFGDRVKIWLTINEPIVECDWYYGQGVLAPQLDYYVGPYMCNKNLLLSHAKAYRVYDHEFRHKYHGKLSIVNHLLWLKPYSSEYEEDAEIARQFLTGRYAHAIYSKKGGWPSVVEKTVAKVSKEQGFRESRLPPFTKEEIELVRGTYDFFAMNHYTSRLVRAAEPDEDVVESLFTYIPDADLVLENDPTWTYGYSETMPVLLAIQEGINVIGYTYWSLMDNFEWTGGYGVGEPASARMGRLNRSDTTALQKTDVKQPPVTSLINPRIPYYPIILNSQKAGKSENIWDRFVHEHPERIDDRSTGDVACDSYHNWRRDLEMAEELGLDFYRTLVRPISCTKSNRFGGWANPLIVDWFEDYAKVVFAHFGDRVKLWLTINEPVILCEAFFNAEVFPPAFISPDLGVYLCSKHVMLAHAKAWRVYDKLLKPKYHGRVSLTTHIAWFESLAPEYEELAELTMLNFGGRYSHAIYSKIGGWPPALEKALAEVSLKRGYSRPQLPPFTQEEIELVRGTYDFFALNHYTSRLMRTAKEGEKFTEWPLGDVEDLNGIIVRKADWAQAATSWFYVNPEGIRKSLVWLKQQYGDLEVMITENGLATKAGLDDQDRVQYYRDYLEQVLLAINEDGVNVTAYTAWTLMDNYEWNNGYTVKFGLYEVNFTDPGRKRTPRASAHYYANIIRTHSLDVPTTSIQL